jgi:hypothetical protein
VRTAGSQLAALRLVPMEARPLREVFRDRMVEPQPGVPLSVRMVKWLLVAAQLVPAVMAEAAWLPQVLPVWERASLA